MPDGFFSTKLFREAAVDIGLVFFVPPLERETFDPSEIWHGISGCLLVGGICCEDISTSGGVCGPTGVDERPNGGKRTFRARVSSGGPFPVFLGVGVEDRAELSNGDANCDRATSCRVNLRDICRSPCDNSEALEAIDDRLDSRFFSGGLRVSDEP